MDRPRRLLRLLGLWLAVLLAAALVAEALRALYGATGGI
jgi:hypothetical protein